MARFDPAVEAVLRTAGWFPGRALDDAKLAAFRQAVAAGTGVFGGKLRNAYFATPVLAEFGGLAIASDLPGVDLRPQPFRLDPGLAVHRVETLIDVGRALGVGIFPLGVETGDQAVLAVTDLGRVLAVDAVGEWFLGETIDQALNLLITGRRPRLVGPDDGRQPPPWEPDPDREPGPLGALERPVGAAFYLPRAVANLHYGWLPDTLHRIGIDPGPDATNPGRLASDWGGLAVELHVLDLEWYTVLVIAFEYRSYLDQIRTGADPDDQPSLPAAAPVAGAFHAACASLAPDLAAAFLVGEWTRDLFSLVVTHELDVLGWNADYLWEQGFDLLFLPAEVAGEEVR